MQRRRLRRRLAELLQLRNGARRVASSVCTSVARGHSSTTRSRLVPETDFRALPVRCVKRRAPGAAGSGLLMHRRLRRQLDESLGEEPESSPQLRKLFRRIEKEYRRADDDRASLQRALGLLSDLMRRQPNAARDRGTSPKARAVLRLFEQAPFAALLCDADRKVTAWNAGAERLFGIAPEEAIGRELSMLIFPDTDADRAQ